MHFNFWYRALVGYILATAISQAALRARSLTLDGAAAASVVGAAMFLSGSESTEALLVFFISSTVLSRWRKHKKDTLGYAKSGARDWSQVLANGGLAAVFGLCGAFGLHLGTHSSVFWVVLAVSCLASANADTWATEIGSIWGGTPRSIVSGKNVRAGESGGVSAAGYLAVIGGAVIVSICALPLGPRGFAACVVGGVFGATLDSLLGATVQAQWLVSGQLVESPVSNASPVRGLRWIGNDVVNALSTAAAAGTAYFVFNALS